MNVKLISYTSDPITQMYLAAKRCVTSGDVVEHANDDLDTKLRVVDKCIQGGHLTVCEFVDFTFSIEGITRDCSHQLVRHRHCSFCQQSGRRVIIGTSDEALKAYGAYTLCSFEEAESILKKYFKLDNLQYGDSTVLAFYDYHLAIADGKDVEEARSQLPGCTLTNLLMHCNLRSLIEMSKLRLCGMAQSEIRSLFRDIRAEVHRIQNGSFLCDYLKPKCDWLGRCNEAKCCGHFTHKEPEE